MTIPKTIDQTLINQISERAKSLPRKRSNHNIHPSFHDPVQRFLNALEPTTYIRPHRHEAGRWESFIILRGSVGVLTFTDRYEIESRTILAAGGDILAIEVPGDTWHCMYTTEPNSVVFEFKQGPYVSNGDKNFAAWTPAESDEQRFEFVEWFASGAIGATPPHLRN